MYCILTCLIKESRHQCNFSVLNLIIVIHGCAAGTCGIYKSAATVRLTHIYRSYVGKVSSCCRLFTYHLNFHFFTYFVSCTITFFCECKPYIRVALVYFKSDIIDLITCCFYPKYMISYHRRIIRVKC